MEICINNMYGTVCDDYWDELDARVVCRQINQSYTGKLCAINLNEWKLRCQGPLYDINFLSVARPVRNAYYGSGGVNQSILLDNVVCQGDESSLLNCRHANIINCDHSEDAGVKCGGIPQL